MPGSTASAYEIARELNGMPSDAAPGAWQDLAWRLATAVLNEPEHMDYARVCHELEECEARVRGLTDELIVVALERASQKSRAPGAAPQGET